jgi:hypothetical protein
MLVNRASVACFILTTVRKKDGGLTGLNLDINVSMSWGNNWTGDRRESGQETVIG